MDIYNYHQVTGEYINKSKADQDPIIQDNWLIPAYATDISPPQTAKNEVAVFKNNRWNLEPDFRDTEYWLANGSKHKIETIGETLPNNALTEAPPPPPPTVEELATIAKQTGELYADTGITVPFTNEVANGLMQVKNGFDAAKELVAANAMSQADYDALSANLEISPTIKLPLTPATILPFAAWFWTKRSAFF